VTEQAVTAAEVVVASYRKRQQLGLATTKDVLDVVATLTQARESRSVARASYQSALTNLWKATGSCSTGRGSAGGKRHRIERAEGTHEKNRDRDRTGGRRRLRGYMYFKKENGVSQYRTAKVEKGEVVDAIAAREHQRRDYRFRGKPGLRDAPADLRRFQLAREQGAGDRHDRSRLLEAAVEQARANVDNARASLERAQVTVIDTDRTNRRNRELVKDGFVAQSDVDSSQTAWEQAVAQKKSAEAALQQFEAALRVAQTNLGYATIRSP